MTSTHAPRERSAAAEQAVTVNEVTLVGRVAAEAVSRPLPSGDTVWTFRTIVDRTAGSTTARPAAPKAGRRAGPKDGSEGPRRRAGRQVDTLDCAVWSGRARRTVAGLRAGDLVEVRGSVRRRFFRTGAAVQSRVEVEVGSLRVIRRAATA